MPFCRACGIEVSPNTSYCPDCGEELNFGSSELIEDSTQEETTVNETETVEPEPEVEIESTSEQKPEPTVVDDTESSTVEPESETEEKTGVSIWAKIGVVIAIPISLAGLYLEIASVYTIMIGEYTVGQFVLMSFVFGLVAFLPIAYIYWVYRRSTWSVRDVLS